jgi:Tol biopolymer transport system component
MENRKTTSAKILILYAAALLIGGCAAPSKTVRITSDPNIAAIYINGLESGITTLTKELAFDQYESFEVVAKKEGYKDGTITIRLEPKDKTDYHIGLEKIEAVSIELVSFESHIMVYRMFTEESKAASYSNIWKTTVGSFGKTRLTYGKWRDLFPSFTPDGRYLVFSSNRTSKNPTLWRIRLDGGGGITNITSTLSEDFSPSVSPNNDIIAYTSNPQDAQEPQIWTIGVNGSLATQLREGEGPNISPDGKKILFARPDKTAGKKQIWVMNIDGSEETQLTQNVDYDTVDPKWSPDGQWIVFSSDEGLDSQKNLNYDVWLMAADGSKKTQLTTNGSRDDSPCWDRDGKFIYFRSNRGGIWNIWRFEPVMP